MNEQAFNEYCAEVMGWVLGWVSCTIGNPIGRELNNTARFNAEAWSTQPTDHKPGCIKYWKDEYNPYNDLNQLAKVVEKLLPEWSGYYPSLDELVDLGVLVAFRDFVWSTK